MKGTVRLPDGWQCKRGKRTSKWISGAQNTFSPYIWKSLQCVPESCCPAQICEQLLNKTCQRPCKTVVHGEARNLKPLIAKLRRMQFARSSEKLDRQIEQLELRLEELQTAEVEKSHAGQRTWATSLEKVPSTLLA